jgi:hypothetical protein
MERGFSCASCAALFVLLVAVAAPLALSWPCFSGRSIPVIRLVGRLVIHYPNSSHDIGGADGKTFQTNHGASIASPWSAHKYFEGEWGVMHQSSDCILINNAGRNNWSHRSVLAVSGSPLSEFALMRIRPDLISWFQRVGEHRETGPTFRQVAYGILPSVHGAQWEIARRNRNLGVYEDRYSRISSCVLQRECCLSVKFLIHFINIDRGDPRTFSKRDPRSLFSLHFGELTLRDLSGGICGVGSLFGSATLFPHLSPHLVSDIGVGTQAEKSEYFNTKR